MLRIVYCKAMQYFKTLSIYLLACCQVGSIYGQPEAPAERTEAEVADYIRYVEEDAAADSKLQTARARFSRGDVIVDLVSVVHLGDAEYYRNLNDNLKGYDVVLYELVGGEFRNENLDGNVEADRIQGLQQLAKAFLGLEFQLENIDYEAANFVHADVDWTQYEELMEARNQSFGTLFERAMSLTEEGDYKGIATDQVAMNSAMNQLVSAVLTGNSGSLKRSLAPFLGEAEELITEIEGEDGTVLITERNKVVMGRLNEVLARGSKRLAVFYGAGHMPDLESRLLLEGFAKEESIWTDAWVIPPVGAAMGADSGGSLVDPVNSLLSPSPEIMDVLQQMGEFMEALQRTEP